MWRFVQVGLLFTKRPREEVTKYFESFAVADHATAGFVPKETIVLPKGSLGTWPVSMMDQFRRLGVVVEVEDAELVNRQELNMCTAGEPITPEGAKLLVRKGVPRSSLSAQTSVVDSLCQSLFSWQLDDCTADQLTHCVPSRISRSVCSV